MVPAETRARALREAVMGAPLFACHFASGLCLCSGPCFPPRIPCYRAPHPVTSCCLFTATIILGWLSKLQIPAPRPCVHPRMPISGWGARGGSTDHLCRSHSVSPRPRCCALFQAPETPLLSQMISLLVKGLLQM